MQNKVTQWSLTRLSLTPRTPAGSLWRGHSWYSVCSFQFSHFMKWNGEINKRTVEESHLGKLRLHQYVLWDFHLSVLFFRHWLSRNHNLSSICINMDKVTGLFSSLKTFFFNLLTGYRHRISAPQCSVYWLDVHKCCVVGMFLTFERCHEHFNIIFNIWGASKQFVVIRPKICSFAPQCPFLLRGGFIIDIWAF